MKRLFALCIGASLLTSCGGGGASHLVPAPAATTKAPGAAKVQVTIRVLVPTANKARKAATAKLRHSLDVSSSTMGAVVTAYNSGDTTYSTPLGVTAVNLSSAGTACGVPDVNDNRTCTFSLSAPAGSDAFVMKSYDAVPVGNADSGNQLGYGETLQTVTNGGANTVSFTLNSVISGAAVTMSPDTVHYVVPTTGTATLVGQDADGNAIVSNAYIDVNGNPVTLDIFAGLQCPTCGDLGYPYLSFTYPGGTSLSAPSPTGVGFLFSEAQFGNYNPLTANSTVTLGAYITDVATSTTTTLNSLATLNIVYPTFAPYTDSNVAAAGTFNSGAFYNGTTGAFIYNTQVPSGIDALTSGSVSKNPETPSVSGGFADDSALGELFIGGPGGLYTLPDSGSSFALTTQCATSPCPGSNGSALALTNPNIVTPATDAYYVSGNNLVDFNIAGGTASETQIPAITSGGITQDGSGNVWISDNVATGSVLEIVPGNSCTLISNCSVQLPGNGEPGDIVADPSGGSVWVGDRAGGYIYNISGSGVQASYQTPGTGTGVSPWHMVFDPIRPHILWFDTLLNGQIAIGRFDTQSGQMSVAQYVNAGGNLAANEQPGALSVDPTTDNIYMVYDGGSNVVEVTP